MAPPKKTSFIVPDLQRRSTGTKGMMERKKSSFFEQTMQPKTSVELTHEEREILNDAFERAVGTKGGIYDRDILRHLLEDVHHPCQDSDLDTIFSSMDTDGDGMIVLDEFVHYLEREKLSKQAEGSEVMNMFVAFGGEADGTGTVAMDVIKSILTEFELDFDIEALVEAEQFRERVIAGEKGKPDNIEPSEISYETFAKVFENLLTHRHFRAPSFSDVDTDPAIL